MNSQLVKMDDRFDKVNHYFDKVDHCFDRVKNHIKYMKEIKSKSNQCLAGLQLQAQQPRLVVKEDVFTETGRLAFVRRIPPQTRDLETSCLHGSMTTR